MVTLLGIVRVTIHSCKKNLQKGKWKGYFLSNLMKQRYWYFDSEESLGNYSLDFIHFPFRKKNQEAILQRRKQSF